MTSVPYTRVLVGTDGSATAAGAVLLAAHVAEALDVPLVISTVWTRETHEPPVSVQVSTGTQNLSANSASWANETVSDAAAAVRNSGYPDPTTITPVGGPAETLIQHAEDNPGTLTIVGTVGIGSAAERLLGNVPHNLTHHAAGDVLLVRTTRPQGEAPRPSWDRVALATDGSSTANQACAHGLAFARALGSTPVLLTVARDQAKGEKLLEAAARELGDPDLDTSVVEGSDPSRALIEAAGDHDLFVVGNKGMSGPSRLLGSVSNKLTHATPTDILLVNTTR